METASGGYTVIEVMIVLGITTLLFFSAFQIFSSQRNSTDFSQSMQDLNSKIQNYANQVSNSVYEGSDSYSCSVSGNRPALKSATPATSAGTDCLFLGLAIEAQPGSKTLQTYTVLGTKDVWSGSDSGNPALSIDGPQGANPEPAIVGGSSYALTTIYNLGANSTIVSARGDGNPDNLLGLYNGLPSDKLANSQSVGALLLVGYPCGVSCPSASPGLGNLKACIEESSCANPPRINQWKLCIQGARSADMALITVNSAPGGITSNLTFAAC